MKFLLYTLQIHVHGFMMHLSPEACACGLLPCLRVLSTPSVLCTIVIHNVHVHSCLGPPWAAALTAHYASAPGSALLWVLGMSHSWAAPFPLKEPLLWPWPCPTPSQQRVQHAQAAWLKQQRRCCFSISAEDVDDCGAPQHLTEGFQVHVQLALLSLDRHLAAQPAAQQSILLVF